jgi:uncharacterized protein (DUF2062 family)
MRSEEQNREQRHARFRLWKQLLRFVPRRAAMHRYPLVGRFAAAARKRAFLWSFKPQHLRPAFYAGSILSLMPVMGVQLPLAFVLALLLRANFMILGGLQFITNPVTAAPIYYATYELGHTIITKVGYGHSTEVAEDIETTDRGSLPPRIEKTRIVPPHAGGIHWGRRIGTAINSLVIGGAICGTLLGVLLDLSWRFLAERFGPKHLHPRRGSRSTEPTGPPK